MKPCRECGREVSEQAVSCPDCGAPYPARAHFDGWGFEYRSKAQWMGLPWLHVSFKYRPNRVPVPAKGIVAIGQFACGVVTLSHAVDEVVRVWVSIAKLATNVIFSVTLVTVIEASVEYSSPFFVQLTKV